ncbi:MAG: helix-turn-helix transcriptional regulator [Chloroflexi bacterium]|nr:helix-turn-helix transcriptional regulator [Chloroflexota bacterium]
MITRISRVRHWESLARQARYRDRELARLCKVSLRQLQRHFQEVFGLKLHGWLSELRQCDALRILEEEKTVKEVAFQLGYTFAQHFSRDFKRFHGLTPSAYQNRSD